MEVPRLHSIKLPLRDAESDHQTVFEDLPIYCPHEVISWLLAEKLISLNDAAAERFWAHHREVQTPWLRKGLTVKDGCTVHPISIYGDEAEYTQTKQKILVIYISCPLWDDMKPSI